MSLRPFLPSIDGLVFPLPLRVCGSPLEPCPRSAFFALLRPPPPPNTAPAGLILLLLGGSAHRQRFGPLSEPTFPHFSATPAGLSIPIVEHPAAL